MPLSDLGALGGTPVRTGGWPTWPPVEPSGEAAILAAYRSGFWTITSPAAMPSFEQQLGSAFADYCGVRFGVPTCNGSSAITASLAAVGVRSGDEVIVPVISWIACAAAVIALGAVPVPVEIGTDLCLDPDAVRAAWTARTKAVLAVHQNCVLADVAALSEIATANGGALVEDCSHAHGALTLGRRAGSFGAVASFSLQENKLVPCGEGGVAVCDDETAFRKLQQLRANGREYHPAGPLREVGDWMGDNAVLGEIPAALALARLQSLEDENERRAAGAARVSAAVASLDGVRPVTSGRAGDRPTFHKYTLQLDLAAFGDVPVRVAASALTVELGVAVGVLDAPLVVNPLFRPKTSPRLSGTPIDTPSLDRYPIAAAMAATCITLRHYALLADDVVLDDIAEAIAKLQRNVGGLRQLAQGDTRTGR